MTFAFCWIANLSTTSVVDGCRHRQDGEATLNRTFHSGRGVVAVWNALDDGIGNWIALSMTAMIFAPVVPKFQRDRMLHVSGAGTIQLPTEGVVG